MFQFHSNSNSLEFCAASRRKFGNLYRLRALTHAKRCRYRMQTGGTAVIFFHRLGLGGLFFFFLAGRLESYFLRKKKLCLELRMTTKKKYGFQKEKKRFFLKKNRQMSGWPFKFKKSIKKSAVADG